MKKLYILLAVILLSGCAANAKQLEAESIIKHKAIKHDGCEIVGVEQHQKSKHLYRAYVKCKAEKKKISA